MSRKKSKTEYGSLLYKITKGFEGEELSSKIKFFVSQMKQLYPTDLTWSKTISEFKHTYNKEEGIVEAHATYRHRMSEDEKNEILSFLKKFYPTKNIMIIDHVDERILGGVKIQVEDRLFDFTVEQALRSLHKQLTH